MQDSQNQAQTQPDENQDKKDTVNQLTVHGPGNVEGAPSSIESAGQSVESYVESSGEQAELRIPDEVKEAGIKEVKSEPSIPRDVQIQNSIPKGPVYSIPTVDVVTGEKIIEKGNVVDANIWRTLLSIFKTKREKFISLFKNKQMQQETI